MLSIPYLMPILIERLNADDLEGVDYIDDKMKPTPTARAQEVIDPKEKSETVRVYLAQIVTIMIQQSYWDFVRPYVD